MRYVLLDDLPHQARAMLTLAGPDARRFVQGTITADVGSIGPDAAIVGAVCTVKGKLISELVVLAVGDEALDLLVPTDTAAAVAQSLEQHIIMDDVTVCGPTPTSVAIAWGPGDDDSPAIEGSNVRSFLTRHPGVGRVVVGDRAAVLAALATGTCVDAEQWALRRVQTATPAWRHEVEPDTFPPEVGFVHAVSYDKGCFMGQEPLARIHARGQVNRVMVRVRSASALPEVHADGASALTDPEGKEVGRLTTACRDGDAFVGLAIVRRAVAVQGTELRAGDVVVSVDSGPLGDDQGVSTAQRTATVKLGRR